MITRLTISISSVVADFRDQVLNQSLKAVTAHYQNTFLTVCLIIRIYNDIIVYNSLYIRLIMTST